MSMDMQCIIFYGYVNLLNLTDKMAKWIICACLHLKNYITPLAEVIKVVIMIIVTPLAKIIGVIDVIFWKKDQDHHKI